MRVFQIGAAGGIGIPLARILTQSGKLATGMHRAPEQGERIRATGATSVQGDLISDSVDDLATKMTGHDAVVFTAGAHGTGMNFTTQIDGQGLEKAAEAAIVAGISRFILVSVFPDAERADGLGEKFEHYMRVKKTADVYLSHSQLDWVIIRPGVLLDEDGDGLVTTGLAIEYGDVSRENVASLINALLEAPDVSRVIIEVTNGSTPVDQAVRLFA